MREIVVASPGVGRTCELLGSISVAAARVADADAAAVVAAGVVLFNTRPKRVSSRARRGASRHGCKRPSRPPTAFANMGECMSKGGAAQANGSWQTQDSLCQPTIVCGWPVRPDACMTSIPFIVDSVLVRLSLSWSQTSSQMTITHPARLQGLHATAAAAVYCRYRQAQAWHGNGKDARSRADVHTASQCAAPSDSRHPMFPTRSYASMRGSAPVLPPARPRLRGIGTIE